MCSRRAAVQLYGMITLVIAGLVIYILRAFLGKSLDHSGKVDEQQKKHTLRLFTVTLWIVAVVIVIGGYGLKAGSLMAVLGVVGLALSLSAQNLLSNFFSGCILPITRPFREGDIVLINGTMGIVDKIGYFNTTLSTLDNVSIVIPNSTITSSTFQNMSAQETRQAELSFKVRYSAPTETVKAAILDAVSRESLVLSEPEPFIHLQSYDDNGITCIVRAPCKSADWFTVYYNLNESIRDSFEKYGVELSGDYIKVRMKED